jgi:hypothetical protein
MTLTLIRNSALSSALAATLVSLMVLAAYFMLEPKVGIGASANDVFKVSQTVTEEISFVLAAADVTMNGSLAGITGGTSNGTTSVRVRTNNSTGYNMTIAFSSTTAMIRNGGGGYISNYAPAADGTPDYTFTADTFAQFGYTVLASTTADADPSFLDNGSNTCATGASNGANTCWMDPDDAAETIINRTTATAASGATTTLRFRVNIPNNPIPAIPTGTYTATATLTATTNP